MTVFKDTKATLFVNGKPICLVDHFEYKTEYDRPKVHDLKLSGDYVYSGNIEFGPIKCVGLKIGGFSLRTGGARLSRRRKRLLKRMGNQLADQIAKDLLDNKPTEYYRA